MTALEFYIITYDVVDDRRRTKVAKQLERVGERVQHSVFEVYLSAPELERLMRRLQKLVKPEEDSIRIYRLCPGCRERIRVLGRADSAAPPGVRIV